MRRTQHEQIESGMPQSAALDKVCHHFAHGRPQADIEPHSITSSAHPTKQILGALAALWQQAEAVTDFASGA
jgi:hypothetical protein